MKDFEYTEWTKPNGSGLIKLRTALNDEHPESLPSLWRAQYGEEMPLWARRECGVPDPERCPCCDQVLPQSRYYGISEED